ncbi:MAG: gamma-glutamyltranspeptidase / glutathione hydrolase [Thermomicrobiales bacterium]|nr:gamma-glutamyltranspeptidase / glutathione hydrolase [Thermomicrobiales bacterium]
MRIRTEKQPVVASRAVVTANHPEAGAAGLEILAMGGNAVDAAVAALFSLSVVEPMMVGPCGAGFFVIRDGRTGEVVTLDNYATVPGGARPDMFTPVEGSLENETVGAENEIGYLAVGVPGSLAGWCLAAERFGSLPLTELIAPAVRQARRGFTVSPYLSQSIEMDRESLGRFWATAATFLPGGRVPEPGERIVRADYADTLERMGRNGAAELITGETAVAMTADMEVNGGLITLDDLAGYRLHEREPVGGCYRGHEVIAMGPVSSGGTHVAQMLGILEGFDLRASGFGTVDTVHVIAEVLKVAFADRFRYMADPAVVDVPVRWLVSSEYAAERCAEIMSNHGRAGQYQAGVPAGWGGESSSTTHLNVVDANGTMVSATQTLNSLFGSRVTTPGTGMLLNNCMRLMDPTPGRTNSIAPGKRILSSMSPTLILRDERPWLAIGTPGGHRIFAAVLQGIVNLIDHDMTVQEAVEAPRVWTMGPVLEIEDTFDNLPALVSGLERRGHKVQVVPKIAGGMSAILIDPETGMLHGGSCWRADGAPVGLSGGGARLVAETPWR